MIFNEARINPNRIILDDLVRRRTAGELIDRATRLANFLTDEVGLATGDHVAMVIGNRVEFMELLLGAMFAGVYITPVNTHLTTPETAYILANCGARLVFTDPIHEPISRKATNQPVIVVGEELDGILAAFASTSATADRPLDLNRVSGDWMLYTGGTTGHPKGVIRPLGPSIADYTDIASDAPNYAFLGEATGKPHLVTGPLYHLLPIGVAYQALCSGSPLLIMERWDAARSLQLIDEYQVASCAMVPTMFVRLLCLPRAVREAFDGSSLKMVYHAAAPIAPKVKRDMIEWWGPIIVEIWGATESGLLTVVTSEEWLQHPGTVGKPQGVWEIFAVDEEGRRLPPGEVGWLYLRNATRRLIYHQAPEKTAAAYRDDGAFYIGDIGRVDADGYVYLTDRSASVIISGGVNIYPAEIEQVLIEHPAVADVAVIGVPHDEWGESVKAVIELADEQQATEVLSTELLLLARKRLASYKIPRTIDYTQQLPRQPNGKLYRRQLRDHYR